MWWIQYKLLKLWINKSNKTYCYDVYLLTFVVCIELITLYSQLLLKILTAKIVLRDNGILLINDIVLEITDSFRFEN